MNLHEIFLASQISGKNNVNAESVDLSDYYTKSQTDQRITTKVTEIVANAPDDFDTLKEISDWIAGHEDSAAAMNSAILTNTTAITTKVDKVSGKGLSTNDFTNADKSKLDSLENHDDTEIKAEIAKTDEQAALNLSTLGYQAKNLLKITGTTKTQNGITFTVNMDGSINVNGTATATTNFDVYNIPSQLVGKTMILSGCPTGGNYQAGYALYATRTVSNLNTFGYDVGAGVKITIPEENCKVRIIVRSGVTANNLTFYSMLRYAEITDDTYEPYKPSVEERLTALENAILGGN